MHKFDIPRPFNSEKFEVFQKGISDNPSTDVYINECRDFLFLCPTPKTDYDNYTPRVKKYGLTEYKKKLQVIQRRLHKIEHLLENKPYSLLEIGAGDASFLQTIRQSLPKIHLTAVDKDQNTVHHRIKNADENYSDLDELQEKSHCYDFICLFHVLEHLLSPSDFFTKICRIMSSTSVLIIEVPSFSDPLLSLYGNQAYLKFYFQSQHPYVYSPSSLQRLMEHNGFQTAELINYQRYGLENHLNWLSQGRPGGNDVLQELFSELEIAYIETLERHGKTDTVIWVGKVTN
ncbi:MAG: class I SAM-dependent methyltransferase [Deltaproteobacteria bacterium]|nr:class I SAM-dependent methyltransferase [Deltaproteobacteria bacterium]